MPTDPLAGDSVLVGADFVGLCGWLGEGLEAVDEVTEFQDRMRFALIQHTGDPAGWCELMNEFHTLPRCIMRTRWLGEVRREMELRQQTEAA